MIRDLKLTRIALGNGEKSVIEKEKEPIRKMGKMLVYAKALKQGSILEKSDFELKSPQEGLNPQQIDLLLGKKLATAVDKNQPVSLSHISNL